MSAYMIQPGNIAAVCSVTAPDGKVTDCIYLSAEKQPVIDVRDTPLDKSGLPPAVRDEVNRHFATVFELPVEQRGAHLSRVKPWLVWTDDTEAA